MTLCVRMRGNVDYCLINRCYEVESPLSVLKNTINLVLKMFFFVILVMIEKSVQ